MSENDAGSLGIYYPGEPLDAMYPEIYCRVYPMVKQMCEIHDNPSNPEMCPYPSRAGVERMVDHIYSRMLTEVGDGFLDREFTAEQFGGRRLFRDIILILLLRELLRRRGSF